MKFVILGGGSGKRLWPLSTKKKPKVFQNFISDKSLLQEAYERIRFASAEDIFIATNDEFSGLVKEQIPTLDEDHLIIEPALMDTAPAMSFATKYLESIYGPNETIAIIYGDQMIKETDEFRKKLEQGHKLAKENDKIVIIEVEAEYPNPNLGYAKVGKKIKDGIFELDHFTEKPDIETAKKYVKSDKYYWNTGLFIWKIGHFLKLIEENAPEIHKLLEQIKDFKNCKDIYQKFPKISLDYALIEKMDPKDIWIIPAELGWSDIGTWQTLYEELAENTYENLIEGNVTELDTQGCIFINKEDSKRLTAINLGDMVVINTEDSILVCPRSESKKIKELLNKISDTN